MKKIVLALALLTGVFINTKAQVSYCIPSFIDGSSYGISIASFSLPGATSTITDNTANNGTGYLNQTAMSCDLQAGKTYTVTTATGSYPCSAQIWIDFDDNGVFDNAETVSGTNSFNYTTTMSLPISYNATIGAHRMRISDVYICCGFGQYPNIDPCATSYYYGEVRDYMVTIFAAPPCSGTPAAGNVLAAITSNCGAFTPQLSISGSNPSDSSGYSYQWLSSATNSAFAPIATATNNTYNSMVSNTLYYTCQVTCANGGFSTNAISELIIVNPIPTIASSNNACGSTTLTASGGSSFTWSPSATLNSSTGNVVIATPNAFTNYVVTNAEGCMNTTLVYNSNPIIEAQFATVCTSNNTTDTLYVNAFLNKGLVAYYPFNGNANDLSGNGYNGTTVGVSLATDRFGNANKCYSFAGTSTYITCPSATYFTGGDFTISGWVNVTNVEQWGRLIDFGNGAGVDNVLVALNAGTSNQLLASTGPNFQSIQVLDNNKWVQVLFTYHANTNYVVCYYNGVAIDSSTISPPNNIVRTSNFIGLSNWLSYGDGGVFGSMDDIRIYNRALSGTEVGQLYNYEAIAEAQTTYSWSNSSVLPYMIASTATVSTTTYTVTQTRDGGACSLSGTFELVTTNCLAALNFDGVNDYVDLGNNINTVIQNTNLITVEAWVNPSNTNNLGVIAGNYNTGDGSMQFLLRRDGSNYTFWVNNGGFNSVTSVATVTTNVWQHVAGVWDGNNLNIYINGVLDNTTNVTGAFVTEANNVWIGTDNSNEVFAGSMDELRIWNIVRTPAQIYKDMNCINTSAASGLIAYFNFDNGLSNTNNAGNITLLDGSGNAVNGTLTNFALNGTTSNWTDDANKISAVPSITSVVATNSVICAGTTTTLTVNGTASMFTWSANAASATTTTVNITPANTDTYTVVGANGNCTVIDSVVVTTLAVPTVSVNVTNSVICIGATTTLTASGASTYTWTGGVIDNTSFSPTATNAYTVTGTGANGCTNMAVQSVTVNLLPIVSASTTNSVICASQGTTLNGAGASTYTWTGGVTDNIAFSPTVTATYSVTGTDANGCVSTNLAVQSVTVNPHPNVTIVASVTVVCFGSSVTLSGAGAVTYTWSGGVIDNTPFVPFAPDNYFVTGTDANGCTGSAVQSVGINSLPNVTASATNTVICIGQSTILSGAGANTYTWTGGVTDNTSFNPTATATYTVSGMNPSGCVNTAEQVVTVNLLPTISTSATNTVICIGQSTTLSGLGANTYTWTGGVTNNTSFNPTATATYTVSGTDPNGCVNTAEQAVTVNLLPTISASSSTVTLCAGNSATLTASGASTYTWSTSNVGTTTVVSPTLTATYTITGTDANGCQNMTTFTQSVSICGVGIEQYTGNNNVNVYPNPSNGLYNIVVDADAQLVVTNALGEIVLAKTISAGTETVDIQNQVAGVYFVKVIKQNNQQTVKLIKN